MSINNLSIKSKIVIEAARAGEQGRGLVVNL
jgi:hypothetical protein